MTTKLLIEEPPLQVLPTLACVLGLEKALFVQQLYWLQRTLRGKEVDGETWIHMTYPEWSEMYPFWSERTIERIVKGLEKSGVLRSRDDLNRMQIDRTKWYALDLERIAASTQTRAPSRQLVGIHTDKLSAPITIETTESPSDFFPNGKKSSSGDDDSFASPFLPEVLQEWSELVEWWSRPPVGLATPISNPGGYLKIVLESGSPPPSWSAGAIVNLCDRFGRYRRRLQEERGISTERPLLLPEPGWAGKLTELEIELVFLELTEFQFGLALGATIAAHEKLSPDWSNALVLIVKDDEAHELFRGQIAFRSKQRLEVVGGGD